MKRVAIFGVGPSGLAAAHAAVRNGWEYTLFSQTDQPSELHGCQYLHRMLPEIEVPSREVEYRLTGSPEGYRDKVYGRLNIPVSPEDFVGNHTAWDLRKTYTQLWDMYVGGDKFRIVPFIVSPRELSRISLHLRSDFDSIISTIPAKALCFEPEKHIFDSREIYALGGRSETAWTTLNDYVECNGDPRVSWYRDSRVFGVGTMEWPGSKRPPVEGVVKVEKPIWTNCDCFPWIERLGRYGAWRKSVLVHDVYRQANWLMANVSDGHAFHMRRNDLRDLCRKCGRVASSERLVVDPIATEYTCLEGHRWEWKYAKSDCRSNKAGMLRGTDELSSLHLRGELGDGDGTSSGRTPEEVQAETLRNGGRE